MRLVEPSGPAVRIAVELRNIRLDVQQWRSVDHVDIRYFKNPFLNRQKPNRRDSKGRGPGRCPSRENAALPPVEERAYQQAWYWRLMKPINQPDSFEACKILQSSMKAQFDPDLSSRSLRS